MTISYNDIPAALRYPGVYIEVDGSQAGLGNDIPAVLLIGQKLADGTAAAGEIVRVAGVEDAVTKAGAGSMLAQMVSAYRDNDQSSDLYMLPCADNTAGVQATGTIEVTSAATAAGTLALYIAGQCVSVGIGASDEAPTIATAIAQAITDAGADIPVTAEADAGTVTLTARHKGTCGNDIDIRLSLYDEDIPAGLVLDITAMSGGTGNPQLADLETVMGSRWYRYVALGFADAATLATIHTESQRRYKPPVQAGFRAFCAFRGDYLAAAEFGESKNYEHIAMLAVGTNPTPTWIAAAQLASAAGPKLQNSPVESLEGSTLVGMIGKDYFDWTNANSLLYKGMSIMEVGTDGTCYIKRLISMYQRRSDGSADDAWLDINVAETMERIRYEQRIGAIQRFRGTAAAKSDEGYRPGLRITTVDSVRSYLLSLYKNTLMRDYGWVQDYDTYKANLTVEQNSDDPGRFDFLDKPIINSPFNILAGRSQFLRKSPD